MEELPKALTHYLRFLEDNQLRNDKESACLYQVHEDLRLIRGWSQIRVIHGFRLYLLGVAAPGFDSVFPDMADECVDRTQAVVPIQTSEQLTPRVLTEICASINKPVTGGPFRCITVAIVDDDTTTAYYRIFDRFEEIVHPQWKQRKSRAIGAVAPSSIANGEDEEALLMSADASISGSGSSSNSGSESESDD